MRSEVMREVSDVEARLCRSNLLMGQSEILWPIFNIQQTLSRFHGSARLGVSRVHIYQREGEGSEVRRSVLCGHCGGTDDGACERDDAAFSCTFILGQQRVFSGYASEKCSHIINEAVVSLFGMGIMKCIRSMMPNLPG